jgi:hypothetical protein
LRNRRSAVRLVGIVNVLSLDDPEAQVRLTIFKNALEQLGWEVGRSLKIETRQIGGDIDRIRRYAAAWSAASLVHSLTPQVRLRIAQADFYVVVATSCHWPAIWEQPQIAASIQLSIFGLKRIDLNGFTYAEAPFLNGAQSNQKT